MASRHPIADATEASIYGNLSPEDFYERHRVSHSSSFFVTGAGTKLYTQSWIPESPTPVIGTLAVFHGFATNSSSSPTLLTAVLMAKNGFATCAVDYPGHGRSEGLKGHLPSIRPVLVDACASLFASFRALHAPSLPSFLYGESLGAAVALLVGIKDPGAYKGVVLSGPMCGISPTVKPSWLLEKILEIAAATIPTWPVAFSRNLMGSSVKVEWKRRLAKPKGLGFPANILPWPRTATALELLRVAKEVQGVFGEVVFPILILHGGDDMVCDPGCSEELYRVAPSRDKTIRIFPGMWHCLVGEDEEGVELVFGEVLRWLRDRAQRAAVLIS